MSQEIILRRINVDRYVTPLREGGSMPAIVEGDDGFLYVLKFRGAGQGTKALIAELLGGEIARKLGFNVPELVFADLDVAFGRTEPDEEIQDLLKFSTGLNLGLHYLSGSITYDPGVSKINETLASKIVWLDALLMNMDRTAKNPNMLIWHKDIWLIDHGAALYFHHSWDNYQKSSLSPFILIKDHILLPQATKIEEVSLFLSDLLNPDFIEKIVQLIPEDWLNGDNFNSSAEFKKAYSFFLNNRIKNANIFVNAANDAREKLI